MSATAKISSGSICTHLETSQLQLLLADKGLPTTGSRCELEDRLETQIKSRIAGKWAWEKLPDIPEARFGASLVEWKNGLYLFGGFRVDGMPSSKLFFWKPTFKKWIELVSHEEHTVPSALYHHSAVVYKDEMWVLGSLGTAILGKRLPYIAAYDLHKGTWRTITARGPVPHCISRCITFDIELCGTSLILGSQDGLYTLDLEKPHWGRLYKPPQATSFWGNYRMSLEGRDLYLFGWSDAHIVHEYTAQANPCELHMYRFNLDTCHWATITYSGNPPSSRDRYSTVRVKDMWVVHGGITGVTCGKSTYSTFVYNFMSRTWTQLENSLYNPQCRANHSCAVYGKDRMVLCGGRVDWHGRNPSLSSPCIPVESLRLLEDGAGNSLGQHQAVLVMRDANRCVVVNPIRRKLYKNAMLSDIELVVDGHKWPAHAFVLAEGSQYFERMWTSDLVECRTQKVHLDGIRPHVVEIILQYLYGRLDNIPLDLVVDVVQAADRYEVAGLKLECMNLMMEDLCDSNLADYWHIGQHFGFEEIVNACSQLGAQNPRALISSESFSELKAAEPQLAVALLQSVCSILQCEFCEPSLTWVGKENQFGVENSRSKHGRKELQDWEQFLLDLTSRKEN